MGVQISVIFEYMLAYTLRIFYQLIGVHLIQITSFVWVCGGNGCVLSVSDEYIRFKALVFYHSECLYLSSTKACDSLDVSFLFRTKQLQSRFNLTENRMCTSDIPWSSFSEF